MLVSGLVLLVSVVTAEQPTPVSRFTSDASGKRLEESPHKLTWGFATDLLDRSRKEVNVIEVLPDEKYQKFDGLGGSFMRAGAQVLSEVPANVQDDILHDLFDQENGEYLLLVCC